MAKLGPSMLMTPPTKWMLPVTKTWTWLAAIAWSGGVGSCILGELRLVSLQHAAHWSASKIEWSFTSLVCTNCPEPVPTRSAPTVLSPDWLGVRLDWFTSPWRGAPITCSLREAVSSGLLDCTEVVTDDLCAIKPFSMSLRRFWKATRFCWHRFICLSLVVV